MNRLIALIFILLVCFWLEISLKDVLLWLYNTIFVHFQPQFDSFADFIVNLRAKYPLLYLIVIPGIIIWLLFVDMKGIEYGDNNTTTESNAA